MLRTNQPRQSSLTRSACSLHVNPAAPPGQQPKVAILNAVPFHNEVYTALLHAALRAGADVTAFVRSDATEGLEAVIGHWLNKPLRPWQVLPRRCCMHVHG